MKRECSFSIHGRRRSVDDGWQRYNSSGNAPKEPDRHDVGLPDLGQPAGKPKDDGTARPVRFLFISGKPLNEPVAWYGPIVMNTQEELRVAIEEYQNGTFIKGR